MSLMLDNPLVTCSRRNVKPEVVETRSMPYQIKASQEEELVAPLLALLKKGNQQDRRRNKTNESTSYALKAR